MLVVGAGVIGLELGSVWRRLGCRSAWWSNSSTASCPAWTAKWRASSSASSKKQGMTFKLASKVTAIDKSGARLKAQG